MVFDHGVFITCRYLLHIRFVYAAVHCVVLVMPPSRCRPRFTVCTWYLNWGRILLQDVTVVGFSATPASSLSEPAPLLITETGMCVL
jgi:hypothetical protein